jgi:hypothetical protein
MVEDERGGGSLCGSELARHALCENTHGSGVKYWTGLCGRGKKGRRKLVKEWVGM